MIYIKNLYDEVYQAALAAGSGGIRWNSENRYIQLMDENKNWIDYRPFNPGLEVINIGIYWASSPFDNTIVCEYSGLYVCIAGTYNGQTSMSIDYTSSGVGGGGILANAISPNGRGRVSIIYANKGDSIRIYKMTGSSYYEGVIFYIKGYTNISGGSSNIMTGNIGESGTYSLSYSAGQANCICGLIGAGTAPSMTGSISDGVSASNVYPGNYAFAFCGVGNMNSVGQISAVARNGQVGGLLAYCTLSE